MHSPPRMNNYFMANGAKDLGFFNQNQRHFPPSCCSSPSWSPRGADKTAASDRPPVSAPLCPAVGARVAGALVSSSPLRILQAGGGCDGRAAAAAASLCQSGKKDLNA